MIRFLDLKSVLLKSTIDRSKCVLVQTVDIVNGIQKITHHWKRVQDVEHHGKVILGHEHLPDDHPHKKTAPTNKIAPPGEGKSVGTKFPDEVKDLTERYFDSFKRPRVGKLTPEMSEKLEMERRSDFYDALKGLGLNWKPCENTTKKGEGINLMRAKSRLNAAIAEGFDPFDPYKDNTDKSTKTTDKSTKIVTKPAETKKPVPKKGNAATNTHIRVSEASKKKADDFYVQVCLKDKPTFYAKMDEFGITWAKNDDPRVNFMYAKMALTAAIEQQGFNPFNPAEKNDPTPSQDELMEKSMLESTIAQNDREKNWIKHINKITDLNVLKDCAKLGIIPQNKRAATFITKKLLPEFALAILNPDKSEWFKSPDKTGRKNIPDDLRNQITKEWGRETLEQLANQVPGREDNSLKKYSVDPDGFGKAMANQLDLLGCKKSCITEGFKQMARFNMGFLSDSRASLAVTLNSSPPAVQFNNLFKSLHEGFSQYTTDEYGDKYFSNLGYTGYDAEEYTKRYNLENEGVVQYLNKIAQNNPSTKEQCENMKNIYDQMIKLANCNPETLNLVLSTQEWSTKPSQRISVSKFGRERLKTLPEMHRAIILADNLSNTVISELQKRGYSQKNIMSALQNWELNDALDNFEVPNDKGGYDTINFTELTDDKGKQLVNPKKGEHLWGTGMLFYTQAKYMVQNNMDITTSPDYGAMKNSLDYYNELKTVTGIPVEDYKQIHKLAYEFTGLTLTPKFKSVKELDWDKVDCSKDWTWGYKYTSTGANLEHDLVMANLLMGKFHHDVHSAIAGTVTNNAVSKYNNEGSNYSGNFDYYSGGVMKDSDSTVRLAQFGNEGDNAVTITASQLSDKITQQLNKIDNISPEYIDKLKEYYESTGLKSRQDSIKSKWGYEPKVYMETPIKDIIYKMSQNIAERIEECTSKPFFNKLISKRLDYVPFDFKSKKQATFNKAKTVYTEVDPDAFKSARKALFDSAHCTMKSLSKQDSLDYWKNMMETQFDYKNGEKTPDGTAMSPVHSIVDSEGNRVQTVSVDANKTVNRVVLLNSPIFQIEDSVMGEKFNQKVSDVKQAKQNKPDCSKVMKVVTGAPSWATANVVGRTGEFAIGNDTDRISSKLGPGIHAFNKIGAAAEHAVNQVGSSVGKDVSQNRAEGIIMMMDAIRGETPSTEGRFAAANAARYAKYSSVSIDATPPKEYLRYGGVKDMSIVFRDSALVNIHHLADVSSRTIGTNVQLDDAGYRDMKGLITHDSDGVNVDIDWGDD